ALLIGGQVVEVPQQHEGRGGAALPGEDSAEVAVAGDTDPLVLDSPNDDLGVAGRAKTDVNDVARVVPGPVQGRCDARGQVGVDEEFHAGCARGNSRSLTAAAAYSSAASTSACSR